MRGGETLIARVCRIGRERVISKAESRAGTGAQALAQALAASPFTGGAEAYDEWYDTPSGVAVLRAEVECLRRLLGRPGPTLEAGTGTGRFCAALGLTVGLDPSLPMLRVAVRRGVQAVAGVGEALPVRAGSLAHVLLVTAIEFVADAPAVLREAAAVLRPGGSAVVGFMPAESAWAARYREAGAAGDPVFAAARFYSPREVIEMGERAGLAPGAARSTLLAGPDSIPAPDIEDGVAEGAGFVAISLERPA